MSSEMQMLLTDAAVKSQSQAEKLDGALLPPGEK